MYVESGDVRVRVRGPFWFWSAGLPLALVALILAADWLEGPKTAFVGVLVAVPMLSAVFATPAVTAAVAGITWVAALIFGLVAADGNAPAQYIRLGILAVIGAGAVAIAYVRQRGEVRFAQALLTAAEAENAQREANTDWLTGLLNRRGLETHLAQRQRAGGSVIMIDLDGMKRVNDTFGHQAGDDVIRAVAGRIRHCTQAGDAVGRWGGDEFVVISAVTQRQASAIAERIRRAVREEPVHTSGGTLPADVSFGIATLIPGEDCHGALAAADMQMYRQKHSRVPGQSG